MPKKSVSDLKAAAGVPSSLTLSTPAELRAQGKGPAQIVEQLLAERRGAISQAIPRTMNPERLLRVAQTAVTTTPGLLDCTVPSLLGALMTCAQLGLEPNSPLGHAYLLPYKNKRKGVTEAQFVAGYRGLIDLAYRSGKLASIVAHAAHEGDLFEYAFGSEDYIRHVPCDRPGDTTHFYAVAKTTTGGHVLDVLRVAEVEAIMAGSQSRGKWGPWKDQFDEMGRKTAVRRLSKYLPQTPETAQAVALDEQAERGVSQGFTFDGAEEAETVENGDGGAPCPECKAAPGEEHGSDCSRPDLYDDKGVAE
ncbi:MAG: recombinase RecT [Rhodospirillaceae bacterium]